MIEINLVPEQLRKKRKSHSSMRQISALPKETLIGVGGGLLVLLVIVHVLFQFVISVKFVQHGRYKKQWEVILPKKTNIDELLEEIRDMKEKIKSVEKAVGSDRILWSQKLNEISDDIIKGVWLNRVELADNVLMLEGSAVSKDGTEILSAHKFASNLKNDENFNKYFDDIEIGVHRSRRLNSVSIADFTINAVLE